MKIPLCVFLFFPLLLCFNTSSAQPCQLPAPSGVAASEITSCSARLSWSKLGGVKKYRVKYKKEGQSGWSGVATIAGSSYTFYGLLPDIKYTLSVQGVCQSGGYGTPATVKATTSECTLPVSVTSESVSSNEQLITVSASCPFDTLYCRFGTEPTALTSTVSVTGSSLSLQNLQPGTKYYYSVSTCPMAADNFTSVDSFITPSSKPNIILIILDDGRFDHYSCNGAPEFMHTPNIDRIANEGINFKNSFVVHSECGPSRATIATGVYTATHGVYDNVHQYLLKKQLPLLPEVLNLNGYYTAMVGKTHDLFMYDDGFFDYWMSYEGSAGDNESVFNVNGVDIIMNGYDTDVMSDSVAAIIHRANGPFFIQLGYRAPHTPLVPAAEYDNEFYTETMPQGIDTAKFTENYPSFTYQLGEGSSATPEESSDNIRETLEMLLSVDDGVGGLLQALEAESSLDNTMIIFTSDNGHMMGEHHLDAKRFAYDQSIRVPLFIRYPAWFNAGEADSINFALNIDYMPTILEAAGISTEDFNFDGQSLYGFYNGSSSRTSMYYHYWYSPQGNWANMPSIRAVRDNSYVFIDYGCESDTVQEFFDLINDPLQMNNEINNSEYSDLITGYRAQLEELALEYGDTMAQTAVSCYLANPVYEKQATVVAEMKLEVYPNPSSGRCTVHSFGEEELHLIITNLYGQKLDDRKLPGNAMQQIHFPAAGLYFLEVRKPGSGMSKILELVVE